MQLLRTRPEMTGLLKGYLVQRMRMAGSTIDEKSVTDQMLYSPIQNDPAFAKDATSWLISLAQEAAQVLQAPPPAIVAQTPAPVCSCGISAECSGYNHGFRPGRNCFGDSFRSHRERERNCRFLEFVRTVLDCASSRRAKHCVCGAVAGDAESLPKNMLQDQEAFWTLPFHLNTSDLSFVVPAAFGTALLIGSDTFVESRLPQSPTKISRASSASTAGMVALLGTGGGFLWGRRRTTAQTGNRLPPAKPPSTLMPSRRRLNI